MRAGKAAILGIAYSDNWLVETMMPLHSNMMRPVKATAIRNLVRVTMTSTALQGGKRALADFHVTHPLGKSIVSIPQCVEGVARKERCRSLGDAEAEITPVWR